MNNPSSFLEDNAGGLSATRLAFLLWTIGVLVVWIYASFIGGAGPAKIAQSVITILGILMAGKTVQRFGEKPDAPVVPPAGGGGGSGGAQPPPGAGVPAPQPPVPGAH